MKCKLVRHIKKKKIKEKEEEAEEQHSRYICKSHFMDTMLKDGYNFNPLTGTPCNEVQVTSLSIPAQKCCAA